MRPPKGTPLRLTGILRRSSCPPMGINQGIWAVSDQDQIGKKTEARKTFQRAKMRNMARFLANVPNRAMLAMHTGVAVYTTYNVYISGFIVLPCDYQRYVCHPIIIVFKQLLFHVT